MIRAEPNGTVHFADGSRDQAALVVGADGINSKVRDSLALATWIEAANDIFEGIQDWERQERRLIEWTQDVAFYYGQLAFYPPPIRTLIFRMIQRSDWLKSQTIWITALHTPTGTVQPSHPSVLQPL